MPLDPKTLSASASGNIDSTAASAPGPLNLVERQRDAELLLLYATGAGVQVEDKVREDLLQSLDPRTPIPSNGASAFLAAFTALAAKVKPVTAESVRACANSTLVESTVRLYRWTAIVLALVLIPISVATFVTTSIAEATLKDTEAANALAVKLSEEIGPPQAQPATGIRGNADKLPRGVKEFDVIQDLQTLAGKARAIDGRARRLDWFVFNMVEDPFRLIRPDPKELRKKFDLPSDLPDLSAALTERIATYQEVRYFAESVRELISTCYGAVAVTVLPVMYALLGALAYLLRSYQDQVRTRTFTGSDSHVARFVIAAIGGGVVGLFKNFTAENEASISPLAIAFLVGYAADVFFSFLDSFVQTFNRGASKT